MNGKIVETQNLAAKYDCKLNFPKSEQDKIDMKKRLIQAENNFLIGENVFQIYTTKKYKIPVILSYFEKSMCGTAFSIQSGWGEIEYVEQIKFGKNSIFLDDGIPALKKMTQSLQGVCGISFFKKMFELYKFPRLCKNLNYNLSWLHGQGGITVPFEKSTKKEVLE